MAKSKKSLQRLKSISINNKSYGKNLQGRKIYYEGARPAGLKDDGTIKFGKNILEFLDKELSSPKLIITKDKDTLQKKGRAHEVRISVKTLTKLNNQLFGRTADIKNDIIKNSFATEYPTKFKASKVPVYIPGTIALQLDASILPRLSPKDRESLNNFVPAFLESESTAAVGLLKASTQIKTLKDLANIFKDSLTESKSESWWQTFIQKNILIIQQGYIQSIEKMNVNVGNTKFPDFLLITHDNFIDILEIKQPTTNILKLDTSRGNYYWDSEIAKAIIQTENYIENISRHRDTVRTFIKDNFEIDLRVVRPRGIVLAGNSSNITIAKEKEDFRILSQAVKNVTFVTYDELLTRLENYISVLERYTVKKKPKSRANKTEKKVRSKVAKRTKRN